MAFRIRQHSYGDRAMVGYLSSDTLGENGRRKGMMSRFSSWQKDQNEGNGGVSTSRRRVRTLTKAGAISYDRGTKGGLGKGRA